MCVRIGTSSMYSVTPKVCVAREECGANVCVDMRVELSCATQTFGVTHYTMVHGLFTIYKATNMVRCYNAKGYKMSTVHHGGALLLTALLLTSVAAPASSPKVRPKKRKPAADTLS